MEAVASDGRPRRIGRYTLFQPIAKGGMATVHLGRLRGPAGFARTVALKRLHTDFASDPEFVSMFLDEARLAARIQHPNVVSVFDVVAGDGELFLVMEYVHGESLSRLLEGARRKSRPPTLQVVVQIMAGVLDGLHAAHEARGDRGEVLDIVHRDVSPQNVLVSTDGIPRVLDFGIAKASQRLQGDTREGHIKGKLRYLAPEQVTGRVDRRTDIYSASVVLWEAITGQNFLEKGPPGEMVELIMTREHDAPSKRRPGVPPGLDEVVAKGLARDPRQRYQTARDMALALERAVNPATSREVGDWVNALAEDQLKARSDSIVQIEATPNPLGDSTTTKLLASDAADSSDDSDSDSSVPAARPPFPRIPSPPTGSVSLATGDLQVISSAAVSSSGEQTLQRTRLDAVRRVSESAIATVVVRPRAAAKRAEAEEAPADVPDAGEGHVEAARVEEPDPEDAKTARPRDDVVEVEMPSFMSIGTDLRSFLPVPPAAVPQSTQRKAVAKRAIAIAIPALLVFTIGAIGVRAWRSRVTSPAQEDESATTATSESDAPSTARATTEAQPPLATPPPTAVAAAAQAAGNTSQPATTWRRPTAPRPRPAAPASKPSGCDPPYTIGSDGVRIPKPGCR